MMDAHSARKVVSDRHETTTRQAREAFAEHTIVRCTSNSWLLRRADSIIYSTEIICGSHRDIIVNGDVDLMVFARGPDDTESRVHWMGGRQGATDGYLLEKAHIGMNGDALHMKFCLDSAVAALVDYGSSLAADCGDDSLDEINAVRDLVIDIGERRYEVDQREILDLIIESLGSDFIADRYDIGMTPTPRVYYAHAALARLSDLLRSKQQP